MATAQITQTDLDQTTSIDQQWPWLVDWLLGLQRNFFSDDDIIPADTEPGMRFIDGGVRVDAGDEGGYDKLRNAADDDYHFMGKTFVPWQLGVYLTAGAEAADVIAVTGQITDARADANAANVTGRRLVEVWIATATESAPSATGNTFGLTTGVEIREHLAEAHYLIETDDNGTFVFDLTVSGSATRFVRCSVMQGEIAEKSLTFAA